ncbi:MAG: hypothetical protein AAGA15_00255 [Pseudomonadota bacterium]
MRFLLPLSLLFTPLLAHAQSADEIDLFAAMIEQPEGTPFATATAVAGDQGRTVYLTGAAVSPTLGACLRIWAAGPCHPMDEAVTPLPGYAGLALIVARVPQEDQNAKFSSISMTRQPLVGVYDPNLGDGVTFSTQSALGGWERPLQPATPSGQSSGQIVLASAAFSPLSVGAPLVHPEDGLVGVVSRAANGSALLLPIREALMATSAAGISVPEWMLPEAPVDGDLPPRVESEIGRMIIFSDYSFIGYLGGFYGPSQGTGFDETFATNIDFSVWEIDPGRSVGTQIASVDRALPLIPSGMPIEAPFSGTPGDFLASCVIHATPSSQGEPVYVVQFWRSVPERYNPNIDDKDYDQAATPMTGWAGDDACATAISSMGSERIATLLGAASIASETPAGAANPENSGVATGADWQETFRWAATGRSALTASLPGGETLFVGCTESRELAVAVTPGGSLARINGVDVRRADPDVSYVLLPRDVPSEIVVENSGATMRVSVPQERLAC